MYSVHCTLYCLICEKICPLQVIANNTYGCFSDGFVPYDTVFQKTFEKVWAGFYFLKILLLSFSIRVQYCMLYLPSLADERINR